MAQFCTSCGMELKSGQRFCTRCGAAVNEQSSAPGSPTEYTSSTGASGFISLGEGRSFSLKNGWLMNVVSGEGFVKEDAVLTDKRLYYSSSAGIINKNSREEIVNITDITGTKIADYKPYSFIIIAAIAFLLGVIFMAAMRRGTSQGLVCFGVAVIWLLAFFIVKKSYLRIEYAGGYIGFSVKKYGIKNVREFQRQIYIAKEDLLDQKRISG